MACTALAQDAPKPTVPPPRTLPDMTQLFNGKDLTGWEGDTGLWSIKDGVVRGETTKDKQTKGNTFLIWRGGELGGFRAAALVQHRSRQLRRPVPQQARRRGNENKWVVTGYQAEVEDTPGKVGFLYHEKGRGYINNVGDKVEVGEDGKPKVVGKLVNKAAIGKTYNKNGLERLRHHRQGESHPTLPQRLSNR